MSRPAVVCLKTLLCDVVTRVTRVAVESCPNPVAESDRQAKTLSRLIHYFLRKAAGLEALYEIVT